MRAGLVAALALGVGFVGLIGYFAFRPKPVVPTAIDPNIPEPDEPLIKGTKGVKISLMDKRDPSRQTGELTFAGMDPLENEPHMVAVESPKAWLSTRNGWWVRVSAPGGKLYMPDRQRPPESGTLSGGVDVRAYKPAAGGARPAEESEATATFKVASVDFDTLLMQLRTAESWTLAMPELDATGDGLTWKYSEANEITEFAEVTGNLSVTYRPAQRAGAGDGAAQQGAVGAVRVAESEIRPESPGASGASRPTASGPIASNAATPAPEAVPSKMVETLYHLTLRDQVRVAQGEREIAGPSMALWARLVSGSLPSDALAPIRTFSQAESQARVGAEANGEKSLAAAGVENRAVDSSAVRTSSGSSATPTDIAKSVGAGGERDAREAITLRSKGPATLRALRETPTRLVKDHLAIVMDGTAEAPIRIVDAVEGVVARAGRLEYLGTTKWFQMLGFGGVKGASESELVEGRASLPAEVRLVGRGTLEASQLEADLASGLVLVRGPGSLMSETEDRCVRWREQADVSMLMVDGAMAASAQEIVLQGRVEACDGGTMVTGEHVLVTFEPEVAALAGEGAGVGESLTGRANLKRVVVRDRAMADAGAGGWVKAQTLVADFDGVVAGAPVVSLVRALGGVEGGRGEGTRVWAHELNATLGVDALGRSYVSEAVIDGGESKDGTVGVGLARFEDRGVGGRVGSDAGTRAESPRMVVRPESEQVDLVGAGSWVEQAGTRLSGLDVRLDGRGGVNRASCEGAGELTHRDATQRADEEPMVRAVWSERFSYDDSTGVGECEGDVSMVKTPDAWSRDEAIAQRVELVFRRVEDGGEAAAGGEGDFADMGRAARALVRARALGSRLDRLDGENARVSSRRTHRVASGELLEQITFLEGPELVMDDERGTGWVKGAGRMLLVDERESRPPTGDGGIQTPGGGVGGGGGTLEGRTLITWQGSGTVDRASGRVELVRGATITHQPNARGRAAAAGSAAAGAVGAVGGRDMVLEAERAVAFVVFGEAGGAGVDSARRGAADRERGRLTGAVASGGTYLRYGTRELTAERTEYDAERGIVRAYAADTPGAVLTIFDQRTGTAQTARTVVWNLLTDAFEIDSPGALVTPR